MGLFETFSPLGRLLGGDDADDIKEFAFGKEPELETGTMPRWKSWQEELGRKLGSHLQKQPLGKPGKAYQGPMTADLTALQQTSLAGLEEWARGLATAVPSATGTLTELLGAEPTSIDKYFQASVADPMLELYGERIAPAISRKYAPEYWGTERLTAEEQTREDLVDALTRARTEMAFGARESALNRALSAIPAAQEMTTAGLTAGDLARRVEQDRLGREYTEYLRQVGMQDREIDLILRALGLQGIENYAVVSPGMEGFLTAMAPGAGTAIGASLLL